MHNALVALIVCWLVVLTLTLLGRGRSDAQLARLTRGGEATSVELEMHKVSTTSDEQWRFPPSMTFLEALRTFENKGGGGGAPNAATGRPPPATHDPPPPPRPPETCTGSDSLDCLTDAHKLPKGEARFNFPHFMIAGYSKSATTSLVRCCDATCAVHPSRSLVSSSL